MSINQDDFKKIWASTSSVPEYTFSDADYQDGWEFVGELPPTRAMWDTLQRRNDQKMKYLQDNGSMCFDSVADMVASNLDAGQTVLTKGYHSVNDGGSSIYTIRAKDVADVDDGGSIIFLGNGNVAELITDGVVNVKQFGAYGDRTHDDTTAIQNAIDYVPEAGVVYIPLGEYKITQKITISKAMTLFGDGADDNGRTLLDFYSSYLHIVGYRIDNVKVQGLYIKGNNITTEPGILVDGTEDGRYGAHFIFRDVWVVGFSYGWYTSYAYMMLFEKCVAASNSSSGFAIKHGATSTTFINTYALNNANGYDLNTVYYCDFIGCGADNNTGSAYAFNGAKGISINGCGAENSESVAINCTNSNVAINGLVSVANGNGTYGSVVYAINGSKVSIHGIEEVSANDNVATSVIVDATSRISTDISNNFLHRLYIVGKSEGAYNDSTYGTVYFKDGRYELAADSVPTTGLDNGAWIKGTIVWNSNPVAGGNIGWVALSSGNPVTWKAFGTIDA